MAHRCESRQHLDWQAPRPESHPGDLCDFLVSLVLPSKVCAASS